MIRISLDTGCIPVKDNKMKVLFNELKRLESRKLIILEVVNPVIREISKGNKQSNTKIKRLTEAKKLTKKMETGRYGISTYDNCVYGDEEIINEVESIIPEEEDYDKWIIESVLIDKPDYFVTNNINHFIKNGKQERIKRRFNLEVRALNEEFLEELKKKINSGN